MWIILFNIGNMLSVQTKNMIIFQRNLKNRMMIKRMIHNIVKKGSIHCIQKESTIIKHSPGRNSIKIHTRIIVSSTQTFKYCRSTLFIHNLAYFNLDIPLTQCRHHLVDKSCIRLIAQIFCYKEQNFHTLPYLLHNY